MEDKVEYAELKLYETGKTAFNSKRRSSLRNQRDPQREESFQRGAAKPCGEWEGDAFALVCRQNCLTLKKTIPPATQANDEAKFLAAI